MQPFKTAANLQQQHAAQQLAAQRTIQSSDLQSLKRLDEKILKHPFNAEDCVPKQFGTGWGAHDLCTKHMPAQPCYFYSFGKYHKSC